jgi:hypothetical protein
MCTRCPQSERSRAFECSRCSTRKRQWPPTLSGRRVCLRDLARPVRLSDLALPARLAEDLGARFTNFRRVSLDPSRIYSAAARPAPRRLTSSQSDSSFMSRCQPAREDTRPELSAVSSLSGSGEALEACRSTPCLPSRVMSSAPESARAYLFFFLVDL